MYLSLPIPPSRGGRVALQACLDALVNKEVMTGSEAWYVFRGYSQTHAQMTSQELS